MLPIAVGIGICKNAEATYTAAAIIPQKAISLIVILFKITSILPPQTAPDRFPVTCPAQKSIFSPSEPDSPPLPTPVRDASGRQLQGPGRRGKPPEPVVPDIPMSPGRFPSGSGPPGSRSHLHGPKGSGGFPLRPGPCSCRPEASLTGVGSGKELSGSDGLKIDLCACPIIGLKLYAYNARIILHTILYQIYDTEPVSRLLQRQEQRAGPKPPSGSPRMSLRGGRRFRRVLGHGDETRFPEGPTPTGSVRGSSECPAQSAPEPAPSPGDIRGLPDGGFGPARCSPASVITG